MSTVGETLHLRAVPDQTEPGSPRDRSRRDFRVVEDGLDLAARVARFLGATLLVTFIIGLVGALVLHATIIESQRDLDARNAQITQLEHETEAMRHELAELEAPARIVDAAKRLGMIEAPSIVYLNVENGQLDDRTITIAKNQLQAPG